MPASMFNQKQKNSFLKWYDECLGKTSENTKTETKKYNWQDNDDENYDDYNYDDDDSSNQ